VRSLLALLVLLLPALPAAGEESAPLARDCQRFRLILDGGAVVEGQGAIERKGDLVLFHLPDGRPVSLQADRVVEVEPVLPKGQSLGPPPAAAPAGPVPPTGETRVFTNETLPPLPDDPPSSVRIPEEERQWAEGLAALDYEGFLDRNGNDETWWRSRAGSLRAALDEAELEVLYTHERLAGMQSLILQLSGPGTLPTPLGAELTRAREEHEAALEWRDSLRLAWRDLREEARVAGALPGWLR
jgi:hypothetical protein